MTDPSERPIDFSPLASDTARRAARVAARVNERVRAERDLWGGVRSRLARYALPATLAAAASLAAILLSGRHGPGTSERFTELVMGQGPATRWIVQNRRPDVAELVALVAPRR